MRNYSFSGPLSIVALFMFGACSHSGKHTMQSEDAPIVDVAKAYTDSVTIYQTYPGVLHADHAVDLVARVDGYYLGSHYKDGDWVDQGQVVYSIEDTKYRDAVKQAESSLATARSNYDYCAMQYQAMKKALESDAVAQVEVSKAKSAMEQAQASIRNAEAALATARTNLSYCTVRAPRGGHLTAGLLGAGAYVAGAGSPVTLGTLYEDSQVWAEFFIDDAAAQQVLREQNKRVLDSIPLNFDQNMEHHYSGYLTYVAPEIDKQTGTLQLRVKTANPYRELRDGMYVSISLPQTQDAHAILVRDASISSDQLGKYLYVVNDSNKVVYTPVKVGQLVNDTLRIVTSGIKPGQRYVKTALLKVRDGMTVSPRQ